MEEGMLLAYHFFLLGDNISKLVDLKYMKFSIAICLLLCICLIGSINAQNANGRTTIYGVDRDMKDGDSIGLTLFGRSIGFSPDGEAQYYCKVKNGKFSFSFVQHSNIKYFTLFEKRYDSVGRRRTLYGLPVTKGAKLYFLLAPDKTVISGAQSLLAQKAYEVRQIASFYLGRFRNSESIFINVLETIKTWDTIEREEHSFIEKLTSNVTSADRKLLYADAEIQGELGKLNAIQFYYGSASFKKEMKEYFLRNGFKGNGQMFFKGRLNKLDEGKFSISSNYVDYVVTSLFNDSLILAEKPLDFVACYKFIKSNYQPKLRDEIIAHLLFSSRFSKIYNVDGSAFKKVVTEAQDNAKDKEIKALLTRIKDTWVVGASAYDFTFEDSTGSKVHRSTFLGKPVLIDVWFTGCGNCAEITPYLKEVEESLDTSKYYFLSVSIDESFSMWMNSLKEGKYATPFSQAYLARANGSGENRFVTHYNIDGCPTLLLIDRNGKIFKSPIDPRRDNGRNLRQLLLEVSEE